MKSAHDRHLELVDAVNDARTHQDHRDAELKLSGFRDALEHLGHRGFLINADIHSMKRFGEDRNMCCGVLLDWMPLPPPPESPA